MVRTISNSRQEDSAETELELLAATAMTKDGRPDSSEAPGTPWFARMRPITALTVASLVVVFGLVAFATCSRRSPTWLPGRLQEFMEAVGGAARLSRIFPHGESAVSSVPGDSFGDDLLPWHEAKARAERTVDKLTTHEIHGLLHGVWGQGPGYYVGNVEPLPSRGIPPLKMQDASSGFRTLYPMIRGTTTQWPCLLALASTWDEKIVSDVAGAIAREFVGKGANVLLGPSVNVHRTAYGGRNFEYLSGEDPHLGSRLTKAYVTAIQQEGVMAVVKHFAFNEQETARGHESSDVDERTAWELYYPPFEAALEAGATAVMCSYNLVNGTSACENEALLQRDLRGKMGFQGFVMSDWTATHSTESMERGLDMEQPHGHWFSEQKLLREVSAKVVHDTAMRVLSSVYRLRLDEKPGCVPPCMAEFHSNQRSEAHLQLARYTATQAVTLLKNDGVLPLDPRRVRKLAILGRAADAGDDLREWGSSPYAGGGSGHVLAPSVVTPLAAIRKRAEASGVEVLDGSDASFPDENGNRSKGFVDTRELVSEADVVIIVACALSTEGKDRKSLALQWEADSLISAVAKLRPTVVLLHTPGAVLTPWRDEAAAIANLFYGGEQTGWAWAAVLFGDHSPTGRLPIGFPASEADVIKPGVIEEENTYYHVPYVEGMLTSYRSPVRQAFAFGHGLTYTNFRYQTPQLLLDWRCAEAVCLTVNITNTGARTGIEVAQVYLQFVQAASEALLEPRFMLRSFQKTRSLHPGESQELLFALTTRDLSTYDAGFGWQRRLDVRVHVGASSADIRHVVELPASHAARPVRIAWPLLAMVIGVVFPFW